MLVLACLFLFSLTAGCQARSLEEEREEIFLYINEVMSSNEMTKYGSSGLYGDWIEIYNAGEAPVNMKGFFLSDNPKRLRKWTFPDVEIGPGEYLILHATGEDRVTEGGEVHTGFKISADGEEIILTAPDGMTVIDYVNVVPLPDDYSYGRKPDGSDNWYIFDQENVTPGKGNDSSTAFTKKLQSPVFSHPPGIYSQAFELELKAENEDVVIHYTLDGSEPTESSPVYTGPIPIKGEFVPISPVQEITKGKEPEYPISYIETNPKDTKEEFRWYPPKGKIVKGTVVRAKAFCEGAVPSETVTCTYIVNSERVPRYTMPVVSIVTDIDNLFDYWRGIYVPGEYYYKNGYGDDWWGRPNANYHQRGDEWERPAHIEIFEIGGELVVSQDVGIRIHAGGSRALPQKSLRIYARKQYSRSTIEYELFPGLTGMGTKEPVTEFKRLLLRNGGQNYETQFIVDLLAPELLKGTTVATQAYRPVIVFINGEYWGIHNLRERLDEHYLKAHFGLEEDEVAILENDGALVHGTEEDAQHYREMIDYIETHSMGSQANYEKVKEYMDIDNYTAYQAFQIYTGNYDWPGNNIRFWRTRQKDETSDDYWRDGRWRWMVYDVDYAFGSLSYIPFDYNSLEHATKVGGTEWPNPDWSTFLFRSLLKNEEFKFQFINTLLDQMNTIFKPAYLINKIEELERIFYPEMREHINRWNRYPAPSVWEWSQNIGRIKDFVKERPKIMYDDIREFFRLKGFAYIRLDVSDPGQGIIKINTLEITENTPGASKPVYPWQGAYGIGVPVEISAVPKPGYRFVEWEGVKEEKYQNPLKLTPEGAVNIKAVFEPVEEK